MIRQCEGPSCQALYDDQTQLGVCPHTPFRLTDEERTARDRLTAEFEGTDVIEVIE